MPSTNKTPNINLNQWDITDKPWMKDFNQDRLNIESIYSSIMSKFESLMQDLVNYFVAEHISNNQYKVTTPFNYGVIDKGQVFILKPDTDSTGAVSFLIDSVTAIPVVHYDNTEFNDIRQDFVYTFTYDGANFVCLNRDAFTGNHIMVDCDTNDYNLIGNRITDSKSWNGICIKQTTGSLIPKDLIVYTFNNLRYGNYLCDIRISSSDITSTSDLIKFEIFKKSSPTTYTSIISKNIPAIDFSVADEFQNFFLEFNYDIPKAEGNELKVVVSILPQTTAVDVKFENLLIYPNGIGV